MFTITSKTLSSTSFLLLRLDRILRNLRNLAVVEVAAGLGNERLRVLGRRTEAEDGSRLQEEVACSLKEV
jgi:hypothetical protein